VVYAWNRTQTGSLLRQKRLDGKELPRKNEISRVAATTRKTRLSFEFSLGTVPH
jgi:hypothetical protein